MIKKFHLIRLALSGLISVVIWKIATAMILLETMNTLEFIHFAEEQNIDITNIEQEMLFIPNIWYYAIGILLIVAVWKWFGLPKKLYTGQLDGMIRYIFPRYYRKE